MDQHQQIDDAKGDIAALETEISSLERELGDLVQEVRTLEQDVRDEELKKIYNGTGARPEATNDAKDDDYDVPVVQHSYLDDSIAGFFSNVKETEPNGATLALDGGIAARHQWLVETKENILYENVYRLVGVTAFSIDQPDTLGLRFDTYSSSKKVFMAPHYVILRRDTLYVKESDTTTERWKVYRDTIPSYIGLTALATKLESSSPTAVDDFVHGVRDSLVEFQFKHDTFDSIFDLDRQLFNMSPMKVVSRIDKDIACQMVKLELHNAVHETSDLLILECSATDVVAARYDPKFKPSQEATKLHRAVETILRCPIRHLLAEFTRCVKLLIDNNIL